MQAGLVSQRLALRDIFTAGGLTRRIFVAVVHVSVTVQPTESDEAERRPWCLCDASRRARSNQAPAGASIGGRIYLQMSDSAFKPYLPSSVFSDPSPPNCRCDRSFISCLILSI